MRCPPSCSCRTAERIGEARPLATVADDEIGEALELLWGSAAVNTWNTRRAAVLSWLGWCRDRGYDGPTVPVWAKRLAVPDSETPAHSKMAIDRLVAGGRCTCLVKAKGARTKNRRRGQVRGDYVLETVYRDAGTARLLKGRTRGPVFVTRRRPGPGKVVSPRDVCPDTGLAWLSYGQVRALLDEHTAFRGPGTGWDLHEYRHSSLTTSASRARPC
jgi:hypothetical protein